VFFKWIDQTRLHFVTESSVFEISIGNSPSDFFCSSHHSIQENLIPAFVCEIRLPGGTTITDYQLSPSGNHCVLCGTQQDGIECLQIFSRRDETYSMRNLSNVYLSTHLIGDDYYGDTLSYCQPMPDSGPEGIVYLLQEKLASDQTTSPYLCSMDPRKEQFMFLLPVNEYLLLIFSRAVPQQQQLQGDSKIKISLWDTHKGKLMWQSETTTSGNLVPCRIPFKSVGTPKSCFLQVNNQTKPCEVTIMSIEVNIESILRSFSNAGYEEDAARIRSLPSLLNKFRHQKIAGNCPPPLCPQETHQVIEVASTPDTSLDMRAAPTPTPDPSVIMVPSLPHPSPRLDHESIDDPALCSQDLPQSDVQSVELTASTRPPSPAPDLSTTIDDYDPSLTESLPSSTIEHSQDQVMRSNFLFFEVVMERLQSLTTQLSSIGQVVIRISNTQYDQICGLTDHPHAFSIRPSPPDDFQFTIDVIEKRILSLIFKSYDLRFKCSICGKEGNKYTFRCSRAEVVQLMRGMVVCLKTLEMAFLIGGLPQYRVFHGLGKMADDIVEQ
jgi:hypothetical protein